MSKLSNNLRIIRELLNITQSEFAELFDIKDKKDAYSKDKVYNYESGKAGVPRYNSSTAGRRCW